METSPTTFRTAKLRATTSPQDTNIRHRARPLQGHRQFLPVSLHEAGSRQKRTDSPGARKEVVPQSVLQRSSSPLSTFERPKSHRTTCPFESSRMFSGLRSLRSTRRRLSVFIHRCEEAAWLTGRQPLFREGTRSRERFRPHSISPWIPRICLRPFADAETTLRLLRSR